MAEDAEEGDGDGDGDGDGGGGSAWEGFGSRFEAIFFFYFRWCELFLCTGSIPRKGVKASSRRSRSACGVR